MSKRAPKPEIAKPFHYMFERLEDLRDLTDHSGKMEEFKESWRDFAAMPPAEKIRLTRLTADFAVSALASTNILKRNCFARMRFYGSFQMPEGQLDWEQQLKLEKRLRRFRDEQIYLHSLYTAAETQDLLPEALDFLMRHSHLAAAGLAELALCLEAINRHHRSNSLNAMADDLRQAGISMQNALRLALDASPK